MKDIIGTDLKVNLDEFYQNLQPMINQLRVGGYTDVADMLEKAMQAYNDLPPEARAQSNNKIDGMMTNIKKKISAGGMEDSEIVLDQLQNAISRSVEVADPALMAQIAGEGGQSIKQLLQQGDITYAQMRKLTKGDRLLTAIVNGSIKAADAGKFLTKWSQSKRTRDAVKKLDPAMWRNLNEAWIGRNVDRFLATRDAQGTVTKVINDGKSLRGFMQSNKDDVLDMIGENGYETMINFTHYLDATKNYIGKVEDIGWWEQTAKGIGKGTVGAAGGAMFAGGAGLPARLGAAAGGVISVGATELVGGIIVQQLLKPNSIKNIVFGRGVPAIAKRPSLLGGPLSFEEQKQQRPNPHTFAY